MRQQPADLPLIVRPATAADFPTIAQQLIQLYEAELPGALSGPPERLQQLLHYTLAAKQGQGLRGRYIACRGDTIVASAALDRPGGSTYERAPAGTVGQALELIGYRATLRLLSVVARSLVAGQLPHDPDGIWLHSLVVDTSYRGQGIGRVLLGELEQHARGQGAQTIWLQVLAMNTPARALYQSAGYADAWAAPRWHSLLAWPSYHMRKAVA